MCMGHSALPTCGICPVKNGSARARVRNMAARISCRRFLCLDDIIFTSLCVDIIALNDCCAFVATL